MIQTIAPSVPCGQINAQLVAGINKAWPKLTMEEKFDQKPPQTPSFRAGKDSDMV